MTVFPQAGSVLNQLLLHLSNEFSHSQYKIHLLSEWQDTHHHHAFNYTHSRKLRTVNNTDAWSWSCYLTPWSSASWQDKKFPAFEGSLPWKSELPPPLLNSYHTSFSASILVGATQDGSTMYNMAVPRKGSTPWHNFSEQNRLAGREKPIVHCCSSELFAWSVNMWSTWTQVIYGSELNYHATASGQLSPTQKVQMQPVLLSASTGTGCYGHVPITTVWPRTTIHPALPYWFQWPHTAGQHSNHLWKLHQCLTFTQTQNKIADWNRVTTSLDGM